MNIAGDNGKNDQGKEHQMKLSPDVGMGVADLTNFWQRQDIPFFIG